MTHKNLNQISLIAVAIFLAVAAGCASAKGGSQAARSAAVAPQGPAFEVSSMLSGSYKLKDPNSELRLNIGSTRGTGTAFSLLATASGTYNGKDVSQQGVLRVSSEGPDVLMSIIPHFSPVTELAPNVNRFSSTELRASCDFPLTSEEGRWVGTTVGSGTCIQAVAGATGQWQVEILPDALRFTEVGTKQALVFEKTGERESR